MAKKLSEEKVQLFPKEDKDQIMRLFKVAALSSGQVSLLFELYRKYVNPNQPFPSSNCGNCPQNISAVFSQFRDWMSRNYSKFE